MTNDYEPIIHFPCSTTTSCHHHDDHDHPLQQNSSYYKNASSLQNYCTTSCHRTKLPHVPFLHHYYSSTSRSSLPSFSKLQSPDMRGTSHALPVLRSIKNPVSTYCTSSVSQDIPVHASYPSSMTNIMFYDNAVKNDQNVEKNGIFYAPHSETLATSISSPSNMPVSIPSTSSSTTSSGATAAMMRPTSLHEKGRESFASLMKEPLHHSFDDDDETAPTPPTTKMMRTTFMTTKTTNTNTKLSKQHSTAICKRYKSSMTELQKRELLRLRWKRNQQNCRERKKKLKISYDYYVTILQEHISYLQKQYDFYMQHINLTNLEPSVLLNNQNSYRIWIMKNYLKMYHNGIYMKKRNKSRKRKNITNSASEEEVPPSLMECHHTIMPQVEMESNNEMNATSSLTTNKHNLSSEPCRVCCNNTNPENLIDPKLSAFVHKFVHPNLKIDEDTGPDAVIKQWKGIDYFYENYIVKDKNYEILYSSLGDNEDDLSSSTAVIRVKLQYEFKISDKTLNMIFNILSPSLRRYLNGRKFSMEGYCDYYFTGFQIVGFEVNKSLLSTLTELLCGDVRLASNILENARTLNSAGLLKHQVVDQYLQKDKQVASCCTEAMLQRKERKKSMKKRNMESFVEMEF